MSASAELRVFARYLSCIIEAWLSRRTLLGSACVPLAGGSANSHQQIQAAALGTKVTRMENLPVDLVSSAPNCGREELDSTHQFLLAQAVRYRYLAAKARREASAVSGIRFVRLIELEVEQLRATPHPLCQHDRDAVVAEVERPRQAAGGHNRDGERRHETFNAGYYARY